MPFHWSYLLHVSQRWNYEELHGKWTSTGINLSSVQPYQRSCRTVKVVWWATEIEFITIMCVYCFFVSSKSYEFEEREGQFITVTEGILVEQKQIYSTPIVWFWIFFSFMPNKRFLFNQACWMNQWLTCFTPLIDGVAPLVSLTYET